MSFFDSEVVRSEMVEITELQEEIYKKVFDFPNMDREEKLDHVNTLEKLLNKQQVLYTRLSLSDDPEAKRVKEKIIESAMSMGLPEKTDMSIIFNNISSLVKTMRERIDKTGSDL